MDFDDNWDNDGYGEFDEEDDNEEEEHQHLYRTSRF